jgi:hypothetical protein
VEAKASSIASIDKTTIPPTVVHIYKMWNSLKVQVEMDQDSLQFLKKKIKIIKLCKFGSFYALNDMKIVTY